MHWRRFSYKWITWNHGTCVELAVFYPITRSNSKKPGVRQPQASTSGLKAYTMSEVVETELIWSNLDGTIPIIDYMD